MTPLGHVSETLKRLHLGLHDWLRGLMQEGGLDLGVLGRLPKEGAGPTLVVLPYQTVLESQSATPVRPLVPAAPSFTGGSVPAGWVDVARGMTSVLLDQYPKRPGKGPGLGPIDPRPPLADLPKPIREWAKKQGRPWVIGKDYSVLPSVQWRESFSFVLRFSALVTDSDGQSADLDLLQVRALGLVAAGIRQQRSFPVDMPPLPVTDDLRGLLTAMRDSAQGEAREQLDRGLDAVLGEIPTAIGVYPHNELTDNDLALFMQTLARPMQPTLIFACRVSLGAGPELTPGATPDIPPVGRPGGA